MEIDCVSEFVNMFYRLLAYLLILVWPAVLTEDCGFPPSLQANIGIVP
jgi:hypothetical protein